MGIYTIQKNYYENTLIIHIGLFLVKILENIAENVRIK